MGVEKLQGGKGEPRKNVDAPGPRSGAVGPLPPASMTLDAFATQHLVDAAG